MPTTSTPTPTEDTKRARSKPKAENSKLPIASVIPDTALFNEATGLLLVLAAQREAEAEAKAEKDKATARLAKICLQLQLPGIRYSNVGLAVNGYVTRRTLSPELLAENGVTAETIQNSYKDSAPYLDTKFVQFE